MNYETALQSPRRTTFNKKFRNETNRHGIIMLINIPILGTKRGNSYFSVVFWMISCVTSQAHEL